MIFFLNTFKGMIKRDYDIRINMSIICDFVDIYNICIYDVCVQKQNEKENIMVYIWLIIGFVCLVGGANFFVEGASQVARKLNVPSVVIGLTIVAFGTSAPEAAVSIDAALKGSNAIALNNVIGSNIFNLLAVVGICGIIHAMPVDKSLLKFDYVVNIIITIITLAFIFLTSGIGRIEGAILLIIFIVYMIYTVRSALKGSSDNKDENKKKLPLPLAIVYIVGGLVLVVLGGDKVVESAKEIALMFGMSETLVGLTIVAIGTSLPELVTSIVASSKGENGLALGNVIGSNIFNIIFILAFSSVLNPIGADVVAVYDTFFLLCATLMVYILAKNDGEISKKEGLAMVIAYIAYTEFIILR